MLRLIGSDYSGGNSLSASTQKNSAHIASTALVLASCHMRSLYLLGDSVQERCGFRAGLEYTRACSGRAD